MDEDEKVFRKIINSYSELETKLLDEIVSHFKLNEEFINSDYWKLEKLEELGLLSENIVEYIANVTKKTPKEIKKDIETIGFDNIRMDELNKAYKGGYLQINPKTLLENVTVQNLIQHSYNVLTDTFLEISNKIEKGTRQAYLDIVEKVYLRTTQGVTYQQAIRSALLDLGEKGITTLTYKTVDTEGTITGLRHYDIEGAVRREIVTANHNLVNEINKTVAEELEVEYLLLSEHIACRPQHFPWQGTIIRRVDLQVVTRYGEVDGMGGPNCKHFPKPYFGNARGSELKSITQEEAEEEYKLQQQQRYLERGIRKWKRKQRIFEGAEDKEYQDKCKNKVKEWQLRNKHFTEENNLRRDFSRENVEKVTNSKKDDTLLIPEVLEKTAKKQNQVIPEKAKNFIEQNMKDEDLIIDKSANAPFSYKSSLNKIVVNPDHEDIVYYDVAESSIHEIIHMKDIRNKITESNYARLDDLMLKSRMYVNNNYSYFYDYLNKNKTDMALCDILSGLSGGTLFGDFGHFPEYWKNDTVVLNELSANLISSEIVDNVIVKELLEEIPPLKELKKECMRLWQV